MSTDVIKSPINLDQFEVIKSGNTFFPALSVSNPGAGLYGTGSATTTIAHNLGYTPVILAFAQIVSSGKSYPVPLSIYSGSGATGLFHNFECYADATNFYLFCNPIVYGQTVSIAAIDYQCQYYLLKEKTKRAG